MDETYLEHHGHDARPDEGKWILHFAFPKNPMPLNGSWGGYRKHAKDARSIRTLTRLRASAAGIPEMGKCEVQLTWWVATNHRRDVDNLALLEKPMYDALVDAAVVRDDTPDLMVKLRPVIRHVRDSEDLVRQPCFTLKVTCLEPYEEIQL